MKQAKIDVESRLFGVIMTPFSSQSELMLGRFDFYSLYELTKDQKIIQVNTFPPIESVCTFRDGLSFLLKSISLAEFTLETSNPSWTGFSSERSFQCEIGSGRVLDEKLIQIYPSTYPSESTRF